MAATICELTWLRYMFEDPHIQLKSLTLFCYNQIALHIASNSLCHESTKYIELDCHIIREKILVGEIITSFVLSHLKLTDIFIGCNVFKELISKLNTFDIHTPT